MTAQQLKNAILQEAIQGRLVPQDPNDEPASVLLDKIRKEKAKLVKERLIYKKPETKPLYEEGDYPFEIPNNWKWVQLSDVSIIQEGAGIRKHQYTKEGIQLLCVTNILDGSVDLSKKALYVSEYEYKEKYQHLTPQRGDIVTACSGGSWGKIAIFDCNEVVMLNTSTLRLRFFNDLANNKFLYYIAQSKFFKDQMACQLVGIQPNFGYAHYSRICFPLPPLAEQKRIVAKIEELLPKVEEYGKAQEKLNKLNEELPEKLKKSILQEAIEGRLVKQDPNDEPASALLAKIREEKKQLVKEGKLKKKDLEEKPISEDEIPFEIPESWEWCRMTTLFNFIDYRGSTPTKLNYGIPLVTAKNVKKGYNDYSIKDYISPEEYESRKSRGISKRGDLLFTTEAPLGNVSIADLDVFSAGQRLITLQTFVSILINNTLMMHFMLSDSFQKSLQESKTGTTVAGIKASKLKDILIPLPPLAEQKRIVEKIEQLFKEIDKLKK